MRVRIQACFLILFVSTSCFGLTAVKKFDYNKAADVISAASKAITAEDAVDFFKESLEVISVLSPKLRILSIVVRTGLDLANFKGKVDKFEEIKRKIETQFANLDKRLNALEHKIELIRYHVRDDKKIHELDVYLQRRNIVNDALHKFGAMNNSITTQDLRVKCNQNPMDDFMVWLNNEVTSSKEPSLLVSIKRNHVRKEFLQWAKKIFAVYFEALLLYNECFAIQNNGKNDEFEKTSSSLIRHYERKLLAIMTKLEEEHAQFYKGENYMKWAKEDIMEMLRTNRGMAHKDFSKLAMNYLSNKYDWRAWTFGSFNEIGGPRNRYRTKSYPANEIFICWDYGRCVFAISTRKLSPVEVKTFHEDVRDVVERKFEIALFRTPNNYECQSAVYVFDGHKSWHIVCAGLDGQGLQVSSSPGAASTVVTVYPYRRSQWPHTLGLFRSKQECNDYVWNTLGMIGFWVAKLHNECEFGYLLLAFTEI